MDNLQVIDDAARLILEQQKEIELLKEENEVLNTILQMQRKREYHSKFLKDFQKENGKNVLPDFDEIYKRYDNYKDRISKAIEYIDKSLSNIMCYERGALINTRKILKGEDKE